MIDDELWSVQVRIMGTFTNLASDCDVRSRAADMLWVIRELQECARRTDISAPGGAHWLAAALQENRVDFDTCEPTAMAELLRYIWPAIESKRFLAIVVDYLKKLVCWKESHPDPSCRGGLYSPVEIDGLWRLIESGWRIADLHRRALMSIGDVPETYLLETDRPVLDRDHAAETSKLWSHRALACETIRALLRCLDDPYGRQTSGAYERARYYRRLDVGHSFHDADLAVQISEIVTLLSNPETVETRDGALGIPPDGYRNIAPTAAAHPNSNALEQWMWIRRAEGKTSFSWASWAPFDQLIAFDRDFPVEEKVALADYQERLLVELNMAPQITGTTRTDVRSTSVGPT